MQIYSMTESSGPFSSPIDLNVRDTKPIVEMPPLMWFNYDQPPVKMKITNSGHTVIVSGKWGQKRPYVGEGPLPENGYVFSQMHFHWGEYNHEGSEHTVEGRRCPMEMHVMHFKSSYKTQEAALKEKDGIIAMVYFFKIQSQPNPNLKNIVRSLQFIHDPQISARIRPEPLSKVIIPFQQDYFLYWGSINTTTCSHLILWFICRQPIGISTEQVAKFRSIIDITSIPMMKNYRRIQQAEDTVVFHVLPSNKVSTTLLPIQELHPHHLPRRDHEEQRNSNYLQKERKQNHDKMIPPGMVPREILVQPTGLNFKQPFIYPGTSGQYLQPTSPIPVFVPVLNSGLTPNYKNMYGYAPMMFPYPFQQQTLLRGKNNSKTYSNENDSSESDLQSEGKSKHYKSSKKTETGSTMNNKTASIEKTKEMEQKVASSRKNKSSRESKQTFSSKQNQTLSNVNNTELPYELQKSGNPGFTTRHTDKSKDWTFVTPFKQMTLPTSCDEEKQFGS